MQYDTFISDAISATEQSFAWGISVMIAMAAAFLAASLIAFLIHRS